MKQQNPYVTSGICPSEGKVYYIFILTFNGVCIPSKLLS